MSSYLLIYGCPLGVLFCWLSCYIRFFSNLVGEEGPRGQGFKGLFSKNFISAFDVLSLSAISFFM